MSIVSHLHHLFDAETCQHDLEGYEPKFGCPKKLGVSHLLHIAF